MEQLLFAGPWSTCASLCFLLAALFGGDLLALRGALMTAYVFGIINGLAGMPPWPHLYVPGRIGPEVVLWALLTGSLHAFAVLRMIRDELPVRFGTEDDEQLARFFNRRSGMERLEAREVLRRGRWLRVPAGQRIVGSAELYGSFFLLVQGVGSFSFGGHRHAQSLGQGPGQPPGMGGPYLPCGPTCPTAAVGAFQEPCALARTVTLTDPLPGEQQQQQQQQQQEQQPLCESSPFQAADEQAQHQRQPSWQWAAALFGGGTRSGASWSAAQAAAGNASSAAAGGLTEPLLGRRRGSAAVDDGAAATAPHTAIDVGTSGSTQSTAGGAGPDPVRRQQQQQGAPHDTHPKGLHSHAGLAPRLLMRSGHVFSLSALNVFGVYVGFDQRQHRQLEVWADTDCLLYAWSIGALEDMATRCSPSLAAYFRNFITFSLADEFEQRMARGAVVPRCSTGQHEPEAWLGGARSRDFTDPLRDYERAQRFSTASILRGLKKALNPFQPPGLRHSALPVTGVMARTRALAMAEARLNAAASMGLSGTG